MANKSCDNCGNSKCKTLADDWEDFDPFTGLYDFNDPDRGLDNSGYYIDCNGNIINSECKGWQPLIKETHIS